MSSTEQGIGKAEDGQADKLAEGEDGGAGEPQVAGQPHEALESGMEVEPDRIVDPAIG